MTGLLEGTSIELTLRVNIGRVLEGKLGILGALGNTALLEKAFYSLFYLNSREWASRELLPRDYPR